MAYLVRGEHDRAAVRRYVLEALEFSWSVHDSGSLEWQDEPGYVQWAGTPGGVQLECSSEEFLGRSYTGQELLRLSALGFSAPAQDLPNHWQRCTSPAELPAAADALVSCLFDLLTPPTAAQLQAHVAAEQAAPVVEAAPAPWAPDAIEVPAVLLRISQEWYPGIDEDGLYDATHGWWVMGPKRERAEYALAVAQGRVQGAFRVLGWRSRSAHGPDGRPNGRLRWGFDGEPADELAHLVGLDVRPLFPPGAANPVRYVNCDGDPAAGREQDAVPVVAPEPAATPVRSDQVARLCARLRANPVLAMSLGSKELFHSNLLAWLLESDADRARRVLSAWSQPRPAAERFAVRREDHCLDLVVELPHRAPVVIENKVFSLPDEDQLDRYAEQNVPAAGLVKPTLLLLSLNDPGWPGGIYRDWRWISYGELTARVGWALEDRPHPDAFSDELVRRWIDLVHGLEELTELVEPAGPDEPLMLGGDDVETLRGVRLHDALQKSRTRRVRHLLEQRFAERGLSYDMIESGFGTGGPLLSAGVRLPDGCTVGWQLQGTQFRRFLLTHSALAGTSAAQKAARVKHADQAHRRWFDFAAEQELGPFPTAPSSDYKHFAPDFLYDYVKVPGITVRQVLDLGELTLREALTLRAALAHGDGDGAAA